jgi:hypothetical protein
VASTFTGNATKQVEVTKATLFMWNQHYSQSFYVTRDALLLVGTGLLTGCGRSNRSSSKTGDAESACCSAVLRQERNVERPDADLTAP